MTICNMSIEAGARAGMIAPDDTTFAYLEGRPGSRQAGRRGSGRSTSGVGCRPTPTPSSTARSRSTRGSLAPQVTWGTNPGMVAPVDGRGPGPGGVRRPGRPGGRRAGARLHGARARNADRGDRGRPRLHRLVHERTDRGPPARGRHRRRPAGASVRAGDGRSRARRPCVARPRRRGSTPSSSGRVRVAAGRLLDVPRHEPRRARARRTLRVDVEPELRGPPGTRRADAPGQPGDGGRGGADGATRGRAREVAAA